MENFKIFLKRLSVIFLFFIGNGIFICPAQAADPVLYFSDIASGPKSGNSDASGARTPGLDGAIVTIWGVNLGASQGNSRVVCNSADAASYYSWGNATQPANLYSYYRMQMISFQVNHLAQDGLGEIYVMDGGIQSNSLPFTVRSGNIFFVKATGDDNGGDGSWSQPWSTINKAVTTIASGDITYICDSVNQITEIDASACVNLTTDGETGRPKSLIVYPNATSRVGNEILERAFFVWNESKDGYSTHWVLSKFTVTTGQLGLPAQTGFRIIGNYVTAPNGDGMDGAIDCVGNDIFVLGNECTNVGRAACDKLYHTIYVKGVRQDSGPRAPTESRRDVGWNYVHDNLSNRGINIYSEQDSSAFIEQHRIHDNVILNQRGDGIMLGYYVIGDNWIYNNLLINAGLGLSGRIHRITVAFISIPDTNSSIRRMLIATTTHCMVVDFPGRHSQRRQVIFSSHRRHSSDRALFNSAIISYIRQASHIWRRNLQSCHQLIILTAGSVPVLRLVGIQVHSMQILNL